MTSGSAPVEVGKHGVIGVADDDNGTPVTVSSLHQSVRLDGNDAAVVDSLPVVTQLPQLGVSPSVIFRSRVDP